MLCSANDKKKSTKLTVTLSKKVNYICKQTKCNSFQVETDLLSENLKVAIAQLCNELQVCNFTIL